MFFLIVFIGYQIAGLAPASAASENFYWKSTYTRGAGSSVAASSTAACAAGQERGVVLPTTAPYAVNGAKAGVYLCYTVCKTGYKGIGPVCWQTPPAGYVSCGAGLAISSTHCAETVANQVISISALTLAVGMLAYSESSTGETVADVITTSRASVQIAAKSPKIFLECESIGKEMLPFARAAAADVKTDAKSFADGVLDAPTFATRMKTRLEAGGINVADLQAKILKLRKALLAAKITVRVGSILYYAMNDTNTSPIDIARDSAALASFAFAVYEITHPNDKVPASTILGTMASFMYPVYSVTY
jgi:hypothetical protein